MMGVAVMRLKFASTIVEVRARFPLSEMSESFQIAVEHFMGVLTYACSKCDGFMDLTMGVGGMPWVDPHGGVCPVWENAEWSGFSGSGGAAVW